MNTLSRDGKAPSQVTSGTSPLKNESRTRSNGCLKQKTPFLWAKHFSMGDVSDQRTRGWPSEGRLRPLAEEAPASARWEDPSSRPLIQRSIYPKLTHLSSLQQSNLSCSVARLSVVHLPAVLDLFCPPFVSGASRRPTSRSQGKRFNLYSYQNSYGKVLNSHPPR